MHGVMTQWTQPWRCGFLIWSDRTLGKHAHLTGSENVQSWQSWRKWKPGRAERRRCLRPGRTAGQTSSPERRCEPGNEVTLETGRWPRSRVGRLETFCSTRFGRYLRFMAGKLKPRLGLEVVPGGEGFCWAAGFWVAGLQGCCRCCWRRSPTPRPGRCSRLGPGPEGRTCRAGSTNV